MNTLAHNFPFSALSSRQNSLPDYRSAGYVQQQSIKTRESLDAGLVIQTRDGDQVTISSSSFSQMDAFLYDSRGYIQNENTTAAFSTSQRELTLASGQSFSFSVEGSLSEEELEDIANILKGIDGVISKMSKGDMSGAMDKALKMGGYDTVSAYSADISYQRSYEMSSVEAATATRSLPSSDEAEQQPAAVPANEPVPGEDAAIQPALQGSDLFNEFDSLFNRIMEQFDEYNDRLIGLARQPVNQLFGHHLRGPDNNAGEQFVDTLEAVMAEVDSFLENKMSALFDQLLIEVDEEVE